VVKQLETSSLWPKETALRSSYFTLSPGTEAT